MKKIFIISSLALTLTTLAYSQEYQRRNNNADNNQDREHHHDRLTTKEELTIKVENLEKDLMARMNRRDRIELQNKISEILELIDKLPDERERIPQRVGPMPMPQPEFDRLYRSVEREAFDKDKMQIILAAVPYNYFTTDQAILLVKNSAFDDGKIEIIRAIYPKLVDPQKNYMFYECLTFSSSKTRLQQIIRNYESTNNNTPPSTPGGR